MHPQTFLNENRFQHVITPAIQSLLVEGNRLQPYRVDISKSGDSILTDISDGIAHSRLVLADISTVGRNAVTGQPYRNGNVMYEVGIALACRQPSDVLLVRDDHDKFLFDVSTIPHVTLDFTNTSIAVKVLAEHLWARIREQSLVYDARVQIAIFKGSPRARASGWPLWKAGGAISNGISQARTGGHIQVKHATQ